MYVIKVVRKHDIGCGLLKGLDLGMNVKKSLLKEENGDFCIFFRKDSEFEDQLEVFPWSDTLKCESGNIFFSSTTDSKAVINILYKIEVYFLALVFGKGLKFSSWR